MIINKTTIDFDDLLIVPSESSDINSRKEVNVYDDNGMLPLFTAPMDTVTCLKNVDIFKENKIYPILPRTTVGANKYFNWFSMGLTEFEDFLKLFENIDTKIFTEKTYILIDIANGHMTKLKDLVIEAKEKLGDNLVLMVGNVANSQTYKLLSDAGADYIRCGVGNGGGCLTSQNVGVGYPLASLIDECYKISCTLNNPAKIVADGGMKNYSDIIKALALGADMVMIGSIFNKALESAGETYKANVKHTGVENWTEPGEIVDQYSDNTKNAFENGAKFYKKFRGMSTKGAQKSLGNTILKTSEGVNRMNPVEYTLEGWTENFRHYLASAMSYTGAKTLNDFIGKANLVLISPASFNRFNK
jgi:IMP dehydrogenase/GMP reductase